jgi:hypothetical protein
MNDYCSLLGCTFWAQASVQLPRTLFFFFFFFGSSKALVSREINDYNDRDEFDVSISTRGFEKH